MNYTIIKIDDRAISNVLYIENIMKDHNYIKDIVFFNCRDKNSWDEISYRGIRNNVWNPYDGRKEEALAGELGVWLSNINIFNYAIENKIDQILVFEDDAIISENFLNNLSKCIQELPEDFDFFALSYPKEQNWINDNSDIGLENIHKSVNQYSNAVAMFYSLKGMKKIIKLLYRRGIEYTVDCFIFRLAQEGFLKGYSLNPNVELLIKHSVDKYPSIIDPNNIRNTDNILE